MLYNMNCNYSRHQEMLYFGYWVADPQYA